MPPLGSRRDSYLIRFNTLAHYAFRSPLCSRREWGSCASPRVLAGVASVNRLRFRRGRFARRPGRLAWSLETMAATLGLALILWSCAVGSSATPRSDNTALKGPTPAGLLLSSGPDQGANPAISEFEVVGSGLPSNVSAEFTLGSYGPTGGMSFSGGLFDGFDAGGSLLDGTWILQVLPPRGYLPIPASATYFVTNGQNLWINISFIPVWPCYQVFTEVGLPLGAEWWVTDSNGIAYFSNGTIIDAMGCELSGGLRVGSATDYQVVDFPPATTYYRSGEAIPVVFGPPTPLPDFPALALTLAGGLVGAVITLAYAAGSLRSRVRR